MIPKDRRLMSREEFGAFLVERADDVTKVGKVMKFVESALRLQNDMGRPVYVFEVDPGIARSDIHFIDQTMKSLGVACVLVPRKLIGYVGEVDSETMGVVNYQEEFLGIKRRDDE